MTETRRARATRTTHTWTVRSGEPVLFIGAFAFTLTQFLAFVTGFIVLNTSPVKATTAAGWLGNVVVAGLVALAIAIWLARAHETPWWTMAAGAALGVGAGNLLALQIMSSLGFQGHLVWSSREGLLLAPAVVGAAAFFVLLRRGATKTAWLIGAPVIAFHAVAYVTVAIIAMAHLGPIEVESERINPAPSGGFLAALVGLLAALWKTRRRHGAQ